MKIIAIVFVMLFMVAVKTSGQTQKKDSVVISGKLEFATQTNSLFTGGRFGDKPSVNGRITASYNNFSLSIIRNADFIDEKSSANLTAVASSWRKDWRKYSFYAALEVDLFDYSKDINLLSPYVILAKRGMIDIDIMGAYAYIFGSQENAWVGRISIGKKIPRGYTFKIYAWIVNWNETSYSLAGEISKDLTKELRLSMIYHFDDIVRSSHQEFGSIRLSYSFGSEII